MNKTFRIFLSDDDANDRTLFSETLRATSLNAQLTFFESGESLLNTLKSSVQKPDIIFLDLKMPGLNGKECLKIIRSEHSYNSVPIAIFTRTEYIDDIHEVYEYGANLYIPKAVFVQHSARALTMVIDSILNKSILSPSKEKFVLGETSLAFTWKMRANRKEKEF